MLGNGATLFSCCLLSLGLLETLQKLTGMAAKILMLKTLKRLVYLVGLFVQIFLQGFAHCCLIALFLLLVHAQCNSCLCLCRCLWHFKLSKRSIQNRCLHLLVFWLFHTMLWLWTICCLLDCSFLIKVYVFYTHRKHD